MSVGFLLILLAQESVLNNMKQINLQQISVGGEGIFIEKDLSKNIIFIVFDYKNMNVINRLWYLMDFETKQTNIMPVLVGEIDLEKILIFSHLDFSIYIDTDGFFPQDIKGPTTYRFSGEKVTTIEGLPSAEQMVEWNIKSYLKHDKLEDLVLKLGDERVVFQKHENDCAAAVMVSLLKRIHVEIPEDIIYGYLDYGPDGKLVSFLEIKEVVSLLGMQGDGWQGNYEDLINLRNPAILHVDGSHFILLSKATQTGALVIDPALGRLFVTAENLKKRWKGSYFHVSSL